MDAEAETSYVYVYPSNHHFKTFWNTCIFHHVENWFPLSKKANLSDYFKFTVYWREFIMYIEYEYKLKYLKILNIKKFKLNI